MAWVEAVAERRERNIGFYDDANPSQRRLVCGLSKLHYGQNLDRIDMTPQRVNNAQLDGWTVTVNDWHYALGQPAGESDGWVGFGGKAGQHWFRFRLRHVGYLHKPTGTPILADNFTHINDAQPQPNYNRANLASEVRARQIETVTINSKSVATWANLWTTPGGGELSIDWALDGYRLKENIKINQVAREWIAANEPPTTPANETYFGFVFELDWSDVPRVIVDGLLQDTSGDFDDSAGVIELQNAAAEALAFMPIDYVWSEADLKTRVRLKKRFWQDNDGRHYLLVGTLVSEINELAAGGLVFDPTITENIAASGDDGYWDSNPSFDDSSVEVYVGYQSWVFHTFLLFTSVNLESSYTITGADLTVIAFGKIGGTVNTKIYGNDVDNASAPANATEADALDLTSAATDWDISTWTDGVEYTSPDFASVVAEITARGGWSANNNIQILHKDDGSANGDALYYYSYDDVTENEPKLTVDYEFPPEINISPATTYKQGVKIWP